MRVGKMIWGVTECAAGAATCVLGVVANALEGPFGRMGRKLAGQESAIKEGLESGVGLMKDGAQSFREGLNG